MKNTLILLAAVLCACLNTRAAVPTADKLLPDDTLAMMTVPDVSKTLAVYSNLPVARLLSDPSLQAFRTKFTDKLKSTLLTPLEHDLGIHFEDYASLPQGQFTVAVVQDGWKGSPGDTKTPALVLLVDTRDKSAQLKTNLATLRKKWVDAGKTVKTEKIRDLDFSAISLSATDIPKSLRGAAGDPADSADAGVKAADAASGPKEMIYIGQADSLLIMADSTKVIEKILAAMSGSGVPTLSEKPAFAANREAMFRDANDYGWVDLHALVEALKRAVPPDPPTAEAADPSPSKIIAAVGLEGLKTAAFSTTFSADGEQVSLLLGVPEDARSGIFQLLAGEAKDTTPPAFVPADAVKFERYRLDGQKFWDGVKKIVESVSKQSEGGLQFAVDSAEASAKEKNPDFDIKKDLFGNLGDDLISYGKNPKGTSLAELSSAPSIFLIGSPNPDKLLGAINLLAGLAGSQGTTKEREFLGHKIYSIQLPLVLPTAGAAGTEPAMLSYAAGNGYLAASMDGTMVEEFLRSSQEQGKSLRDAPGLTAATQKVTGAGTSLFGYANDSEQMRTLFNLLKSDAGSSQMTSTFDLLKVMTGQGGDASLKDWVDFSLLPDFDKLAKYFSFSVYAGSATPDGLILKSYMPTPPGLK